MTQKSQSNQPKLPKRLSPELAEVLHMLKSLETDVSAKPASAIR